MSDLMEYRTEAYPADWQRNRIGPSSKSLADWRKGPECNATHKIVISLIKSPEPVCVAEDEFTRLAQLWRKETMMHSSLAKKVMHPAYQRIIGMGPAVIPLILREMKKKPGHWFWALDAVTQGESPAKDCSNLEEATKAWIKWGETKGYL